MYSSPTIAYQSSDTNKVLRNTYMLLALSMLPTALGAWLGVETGIMRSLGPIAGLLVFMVGAYGLMYLVEKNRNSSAGVPLLLGFTFFMGVMLSNLLSFVLSKGNGATLIATAFLATSAVFFGMAGLSSVVKRDLSGLSKTLFIGVILLLVAGIANIFLQSTVLMTTLSVIAAGIFSVFILIDLKRVRDGEETNYISATMSVYMSVYNVFSSLLRLLGIFGDD